LVRCAALVSGPVEVACRVEDHSPVGLPAESRTSPLPNGFSPCFPVKLCSTRNEYVCACNRESSFVNNVDLLYSWRHLHHTFRQICEVIHLSGWRRRCAWATPSRSSCHPRIRERPAHAVK
jgi:hypothetical protein